MEITIQNDEMNKKMNLEDWVGAIITGIMGTAVLSFLTGVGFFYLAPIFVPGGFFYYWAVIINPPYWER